MVLRFFKGTIPVVVVMIAVVFIAVWVPLFFKSSIVSYNNPMPLFALLNHLTGSNLWVSNIVAAMICMVLSFFITNLNTTHSFISERTFIPALIFILITALLPQYQALNPTLPASLFMVFAIKRILDSYQKDVAYSLFDAGILIGTGSLFYANLIWFGALVFVGIAIFRNINNVKEIAISIFGLITPYIIMVGVYYVLDYNLNELLFLINNNIFLEAESLGFSKFALIALIFISALITLSLRQILMAQSTAKIKTRKAFLLLIWTFAIALSAYFIIPAVSYEIIWLLGIPLSYFITNYLISSQSEILSEVIFILFFLIVVMMQVLSFV